MDTQTAEALDTWRGDIRHLRSDLRGVGSSLTARIDGVESSLRAEMRELQADARRHTDVLTESLRDDIRMVAEAVVTLSAKVDTLRR